MASSETKSFKILMFPWLAHGHIFPFLELAKRLISKKNFKIFICSTPVNLPSINTFIHKNSLQNSIESLHLHLPPSPLLPPHLHTTKNLPSHLIFPLIKSFQNSKSSFAELLTSIKPDLIIFDVFQPWAANLASSESIPAVNFTVVGAATRAFNHHHYLRHNPDFPFPELHLNDGEKKSLDEHMQFVYEHVFDRDEDIMFVNFRLSSEVVLVKTSRVLEGKYIDYVSSACSKRILSVGPLVGDAANDEDDEILRWLSTKPENSTVYVSFGSEVSLNEGEIIEMARGLELCGANFIWVMRSPVTQPKLSDPIMGFVERVGERGIIVEGWAPQTSVLRHRSTCAFVSHCGWSSMMESLYYGVPVVGIPMRINMFIDAKMAAHAGVCVEVGRGGSGEFRGEEIAEAIKSVVFGEGGEEMRRRARELSQKMREEEGREIEETAEKLWQMCCKKLGK